MEKVERIDAGRQEKVDQTVARLEKAVEDDQVLAVAWVVVTPDGARWSYMQGRNYYALLGAVEELKHDLIHSAPATFIVNNDE